MSLNRLLSLFYAKVYPDTIKENMQIALLMFAQGVSSQQRVKGGWKWNSKVGQHQKIKFLTFSQDFKFKQILSANSSKRLHIIQGQLVYNNGLTVSLSVSHQSLINSVLNGQFSHSKGRIVFAIEGSRESLVYSAKVIELPAELCEVWVRECESEVLAKKRVILHLLAVVGFQIDSENELMKKIILQKRQLQQNLEKLLASQKTFKEHLPEESMQIEESNVIYYGPKEELNIELDTSKMVKEEKKVEGGYFSIQSQQYVLRRNRNRVSEQTEHVTLCRKTLRSKKKAQEETRELNQRKMKKEIQIVQHIKNKKYLINYYCQRDLDCLQEILMDKYEYSLQEYISYFADSLELKHKVLIAQQIVESVMHLHASGVVHRDIKPSNFLIADDSRYPNYYQLKIIDFAQSYCQAVPYKGDYACSHPYSPLQCTEVRNNGEKRSQEGVKNKEIDYWSVGMIVYEVFFRKLPLSFSRVFHLDIAASWKSELLLSVNQREKYGLAVVEDIVTILCVKMLKIEQEKRMQLETALAILQLLETYVKTLIKIVQDAR